MREQWARSVWERRGIAGKLLWLVFLPPAWLYRLGVQARNQLFRIGWLKGVRLPRPVISVGNLTVGGTGKTPTCLWLADELRKRGYQVGILSRGYRRREKRSVVLLPVEDSNTMQQDEVAAAGDEPLMMSRLYKHKVGVSRDRREAADQLLGAAKIGVFLLDDGYQHRWIQRDVDLLLLGTDTTGWTLPAGPFREPRKNLCRADFLLATGAEEFWQKIVPEESKPCFYRASLRPIALVGFSSGRIQEFPMTLLYRSKVLTVTGIADARAFYRLIHEWEGEIVNTLEFEDHHTYSTSDWQEINRSSRAVDLIITTEKDILKLQRFPFAKDKLLALRVAMTVQEGQELISAILRKIPAGGTA